MSDSSVNNSGCSCACAGAAANLGVILAGALLAWTGSNLPDLVIGLLVLNGARRILGLKIE